MQKHILSIETSCDETAAAIVGGDILSGGVRDIQIASNIISSQIPLHQLTGGVVPEVAARAQLQAMLPVVDQTLYVWQHGSLDGWQQNSSQEHLDKIDAIAVTEGPGLIGSLLVGTEFANAIAFANDLPLLPINHYEGHLLSFLPDAPEASWPILALTASGGHSSLYLIERPGQYQLLGRTRDDAAGEAFDKAAQFLGLAYPGGPSLSKLAEHGNPSRFPLPTPMQHQASLDFSFSGLKTALRRQVAALPDLSEQDRADLAASFQQAVTGSLISQLRRAAEATSPSGLAIVGGVANNQLLKAEASALGQKLGLPVYFPSSGLYTDNAAMIGVAALFQLASGSASRFAVPTARLPLPESTSIEERI